MAAIRETGSRRRTQQGFFHGAILNVIFARTSTQTSVGGFSSIRRGKQRRSGGVQSARMYLLGMYLSKRLLSNTFHGRWLLPFVLTDWDGKKFVAGFLRTRFQFNSPKPDEDHARWLTVGRCELDKNNYRAHISTIQKAFDALKWFDEKRGNRHCRLSRWFSLFVSFERYWLCCLCKSFKRKAWFP